MPVPPKAPTLEFIARFRGYEERLEQVEHAIARIEQALAARSGESPLITCPRCHGDGYLMGMSPGPDGWYARTCSVCHGMKVVRAP